MREGKLRRAQCASGENTLDRRQLRALLVAGIKLDLRTSRGGLGRGKLPPFVIALITYAVMGLLMAVGLRAHGDVFVYSLFTTSAAMFMTALSVIMEYVTIVAHPDDFHILAHRPVSSRTYFWAKLGNMLFYVTPIALALTLPAAIFGSFTLEPGFLFGVFHVLVGLVACIATAATVVLVYTATLKVVSYQRFTSIMTYVHSGATLVLVLAYFLSAADDRGRPGAALVPPRRLGLRRAAGLVRGRRGASDRSGQPAGRASGPAGGRERGRRDRRSDEHDIAGLLEEDNRTDDVTRCDAEERRDGRVRKRPFFRMGLASLGSGTERAGYVLMDAYMRRDRKLRARVYPAFGLPLAVYVTAVIRHDLHSPFVPSPDGSPVALQEIMGLYCIFVSLFFATAMTQSEQWKASWVYFAAPVGNLAGVLQGARRLVVWRYLVPFYILLFALLSLRMPVVGAATFVMMVFPMCLTSFAVLSLASPHVPLSQQVERGRQGRQIAFFMVLGTTMVPLLILLQFLMQERTAAAGPMLAGLWGLAWATERLVGARLRRRLAREEFDG